MEFYGETIKGCWVNTVKSFMANYYINVSHGRETAVLDDAVLRIEHPDPDIWTEKEFFWTKRLSKEYICSLDKKYINPEMERLFNYGHNNLNQYDEIIKGLSEVTISRPLYASIFDVNFDGVPQNSLPCLLMLEFQKNNGKLRVKAIYSMMNLFTLGILDMCQLAYIQQKLCEATSLEPGSMTVYVSRLEMSSMDVALCEKIWKKLEVI